MNGIGAGRRGRTFAGQKQISYYQQLQARRELMARRNEESLAIGAQTANTFATANADLVQGRAEIAVRQGIEIMRARLLSVKA